MIETALEVGPYFAANIGPAFAEGEVFAEIGSAARIDHAFEQCKPVGTSRQRIERMFAKKLLRCVVRMPAYPLEHVAPNHQEAGSGVAHARKAVDDGDM